MLYCYWLLWMLFIGLYCLGCLLIPIFRSSRWDKILRYKPPVGIFARLLLLLLAFLSFPFLSFPLGWVVDCFERYFADQISEIWRMRIIELWILSLPVVNCALLFSLLDRHPWLVVLQTFTLFDLFYALVSLLVFSQRPKSI